jgi:hypothetical protein
MNPRSMAALTLVLASCVTSGCDGHNASSPPAQSPPNGPLPAAWKEFTSQQGRFKALFPEQPTEETKNPPPGVVGNPIYKIYIFRSNKKELFQVLYSDFSDDIVKKHGTEKLVDTLAKSVAADAKGSIQEQHKTSLGNVRGAEVKVGVPNTGIITARVFLSGNRGYQVVAAMPSEKATSEDVKRFLDSFQLLN